MLPLLSNHAPLILALIALILMPHCGSRSKKNKAAFQKAAFSLPSIPTNIDIDQISAELEAKLTDIPSPLGSRIVHSESVSEQPHKMRIVIECSGTLAELEALYAEQMAGCGWQSVESVGGTQLMQLYKKPHKVCVIMVQAYDDGALITITMCQSLDELL